MYLLEQRGGGDQTEGTVGGDELHPFLQLIWLQQREHRSCLLRGPSSPAFGF